MDCSFVLCKHITKELALVFLIRNNIHCVFITIAMQFEEIKVSKISLEILNASIISSYIDSS